MNPDQESVLGTEIRTFSPEEVFCSMSSNRRAGKVRHNGDRAWLEKESPAGRKYRMPVYGLVETGRYHPVSVFNTQMSKIRAERAKAKATARETGEEDMRWPNQMQQMRRDARAGTTFVVHPALKPSERVKIEAVGHGRHGDQSRNPLVRVYAG